MNGQNPFLPLPPFNPGPRERSGGRVKKQIPSSQFVVNIIAALLYLGAPCFAGETPVTEGVPVGIQQHPESPFQLTVDKEKQNVLAVCRQHKNIALEVDLDDKTSDGHSAGITPILNGHRLEGRNWKQMFPLISVCFDAGKIHSTAVHAEKDGLRVHFATGSYRNLKRKGPDQPVPLKAWITLDDKGRLQVDLEGLYYLLPSTRDTSMQLGVGDKKVALTVTTKTPKFTRYFEDVQRVEFKDSRFGAFVLTTDIKRLQIQVYDPTVEELFELDHDHTYKDRGQMSVKCRMNFVEPPAAKPAAPTESNVQAPAPTPTPTPS
jgi:hypothetical protein